MKSLRCIPTAALHLLLLNCTDVLRPFQGEQVLKSATRQIICLEDNVSFCPSVNAIGSRLRRIAVFVWRNAPALTFDRFVMEALHVLDLAPPESSTGERRGQTEQEKQNTGRAGWSGRGR